MKFRKIDRSSFKAGQLRYCTYFKPRIPIKLLEQRAGDASVWAVEYLKEPPLSDRRLVAKDNLGRPLFSQCWFS